MRDEADDEQQSLLARYVDAFERYDLDSLVALLHEDMVMSMPPYDLWLRGPEELRAWFLGPGHGCQGSALVPVMANASPAFAQYRPSGPGGRLRAVVDPGARGPGWTDHVTDELPRQGPVRQVRAARPPGPLTATLVG